MGRRQHLHSSLLNTCLQDAADSVAAGNTDTRPATSVSSAVDQYYLKSNRLLTVDQEAKDIATAHRKITSAVNELRRHISLGERGSRPGVIALLREAEQQLTIAANLTDQLSDAIMDPHHFDKHYSLHLQHLIFVEEAKAEATLYLDSRQYVVESTIVSQPGNDQSRLLKLQPVCEAAEVVFATQQEADEVERFTLNEDALSPLYGFSSTLGQTNIVKWPRSFLDELYSYSWIDDYVDDHYLPLCIGASGQPSSIQSTLNYNRGASFVLQDEESHQLHNHASYEDEHIATAPVAPLPRRPPDIT